MAAAKKQEGNEFYSKKEYKEAIRLYSEAIGKALTNFALLLAYGMIIFLVQICVQKLLVTMAIGQLLTSWRKISNWRWMMLR